MPVFYSALDIYVITSRIEGGPVPLLESMACGTPVVTTPVGMAREFVQNGVNGLVVPKEDPSATCEAIKLLLRDYEGQKRIAQMGLDTVRSSLTWEQTLTGIEDMYEMVWKCKSDDHSHILKAPSSRPQSLVEPVKQRQWAIMMDSYWWYRGLLDQGYRQEGLYGIVKACLGSGSLEQGISMLARFAVSICKRRICRLRG